MRIQFNQDCSIDVITGFIEGDEDNPDTYEEYFKAGETAEIDICDELLPPDASEIQFADGSVAFVTPYFWKCVDEI